MLQVRVTLILATYRWEPPLLGDQQWDTGQWPEFDIVLLSSRSVGSWC